jgi:glycosyltransferase involved in cell wall biosynthesis
MATIEVLLPVKNALPFLRASIDSVVAQTFRDWRLLILDHGSTDGSAELALEYAAADKRVVVHSKPDAVGLSGLLNFGLAKVDGRYVVRQDGDDLSLPGRFQTVWEVFSERPDLLFMSGDAITIDVAGCETGYIARPRSHAAIAAASFFRNPVVHPAAALNLDHLRDVQPLYGADILNVLPPDKSITVAGLAEDYFLFGQLALLGPCWNLSEPLIRYRVHGGSVSTSKVVEQNACAVSVSRFLAGSFAALHGARPFDPAPFCSHSENVFDCGLSDYSAEFRRMSSALEQGLGRSQELKRELGFRRVLAKRHAASMLGRYGSFALKHGFRTEEWRVVRNWVGRFVTDKYVTRLEEGSASSG